MKHIFMYVLALLPSLVLAQGENDNWYFGNGGAVNFATANPTVLPNSQMFALEACGAASDANGNLLFYTNGESVWDRQNAVMQNGSTLGGSFSSQQLVIVKHPGNPKQYFIFSGGDNGYTISDPNSYKISYSVVDMSLGSIGSNGQPLGAVVQNQKKIPVLDNLGNQFVSEAITIVRHANNNAYWLLIPNGTKLYSYVIDNQGFSNGTPVISDLNFPLPLTQWTYYSLRVSPKLSNGSFSHYLCMSVWLQGFTNKVYSFNDATGQITSDYSMVISSLHAYLPEFNQDASVLFLGHKKIFAVDMLSSTPSNVNFMEIYDGSLSIPTQDDAIGIQRNKYNDIYISKGGRSFLGKIINPDAYGPGLSVDMNFVNLGSKIAYYGLPQTILNLSSTPEPPQCIPNKVLVNPETNFLYTYQVSNTIITKDKYTVYPRQNITMKAGKSVTLLPNTFIMNGATYLAKIEECKPGAQQDTKERKSPVEIAFSLDTEPEGVGNDDVFVYPNPASSQAMIATRKGKLLYWELYDITGKLVSKGNTNTIKLEGLPKNMYQLRIGLANGLKRHQKLTVQ